MIILRNAVQRLYQGVLYVQNITRFHITRVNRIPFTPGRTPRPCPRRCSRNSRPVSGTVCRCIIPNFVKIDLKQWKSRTAVHLYPAVKSQTAVHLYPAVKYGCHWAEFHETLECKQNFAHAPCTRCVYLTGDNICEQQIRLAFHLLPSVT